MEIKGGRISDYRNKLDKTLAIPNLTNDEIIRSLVKNQISECNEELVERRSNEVSHFLDMLRSASHENVERSKSRDGPRAQWKVKQDNEDYRVMYREEGARFHTLLVEGYTDGPIDVCMCISCESTLYKQWWPQLTIPTFRVLSSECLQRIRPGEQISLVRMKLPWPLSTREALIHYFAFEYFQDDLMVVLINSISDSENLDLNTHGFTRDVIPEAEDVVRIDLIGGFALQKVTENRSYFRTIGNIDLKLDFVPTALINFISRQVIGSGFMLYKKEVAAVSKGEDGKFHEALMDPLYIRMRKVVYHENPKSKEVSIILEDSRSLEEEESHEEEVFTEKNDEKTNKSEYAATHEIEEVDEEDNDETDLKVDKVPFEEIEKKRAHNREDENFENGYEKKKASIRPEVRRALETLERAISAFRELNKNPERHRSGVDGEGDLRNLGNEDVPTDIKNGEEIELSSRFSSQVHPPSDKEYENASVVGETKQSKIARVSASPDYTSLERLMNDGEETNVDFVGKLPKNDDLKAQLGDVGAKRIRNKRSSRFRCLPFGS